MLQLQLNREINGRVTPTQRSKHLVTCLEAFCDMSVEVAPRLTTIPGEKQYLALVAGNEVTEIC